MKQYDEFVSSAWTMPPPWIRDSAPMKTQTTPEKTDDQLVEEIVAELRQINSNFVDAGNAQRLIREKFAGRPKPSDIVSRVMSAFCA